MAIHSSTIAWKIPWTDEPGRLQSMGSQRVGHDCMTSLAHSLTRFVICEGFPGGSEVKASSSNAGDPDSIPESGNPLEKEMVTYSSILAWRIQWTEKSGRLESVGSQKVGHD